MSTQPHDPFARVSGCIQSSSLVETTVAQLLERCTGQSELHATLQTAFKAIEDVLIGQEKTINDYDAEVYRLNHEVQNLNTQNADLQLGLQNIAKNMTSRSSPEVLPRSRRSQKLAC
jgi:predicted  nucleic acid-binding Zn-ribbon protein